ncbi:MAG TPA: iron-containing redox enzyme family protein [Dehalococcoidia bacterium]|nr:iron-containing redox enzyme family protein [Dehalococcoidia bacterium]
MPLSQDEFIATLTAELDSRSLAEHPLIAALGRGDLTRDQIRDFASHWYHGIKNAPRFFSAIHSNCPDLRVRRMILENLIGEETDQLAGSDSHPALMLRFLQALGATEAEVEALPPIPEAAEFGAWTLQTCQRQPYQIGIAATGLAHEWYFPESYQLIVDSLRRNYGFDDHTIEFFIAHIEGDEEHRRVAFEIVARYSTTDEIQRQVIETVIASRDRMFHAWDAFARRAGVAVGLM